MTVTELANAESGTVAWTYSVPNASAQYLAEGQTAVETFTVTIDDGQGATVDQLVTVTVTGANDGPVINAGLTNSIGEIKEDVTNPTLSDTGVIAFSDIDLIDVHSVSASKESGSLGGTLKFAAVSEDAGSEGGTVGWTYEVPNTSAQYLANGQTAVEKFTVTLSDGQGGEVTETVTITVSGNNDGPTITLAGTDVIGAITEDASIPTLTDTGTIVFNDVDLVDTHTATAVKASGTLGGTLAVSTSELADAASGTVGWTYSLPNTSAQYLAKGQTSIETFTVTIDDGQGGSVDKQVSVTVTGVNDRAVIDVGLTDAIGAVTEDASIPTLSNTGVIAFTDADLIDTHTVSYVKASGSLGGTLTLGSVSESPSTDTGTVGWTYSLPNTSAQYLAKGQTAVETFTLSINDGQGGIVTETVSVTVTGQNITDCP